MACSFLPYIKQPIASSCSFRFSCSAAVRRKIYDFVRRCLPDKTQKPKRSKKLELTSMLTDDSLSFLYFRSWGKLRISQFRFPLTSEIGRNRPAHRQRPTAGRKRTGQNLRAVISEKILFRTGRRRYIKSPVRR